MKKNILPTEKTSNSFALAETVFMKMLRISGAFSLLLGLIVATAQSAQAARIVVNHDEWTLSDGGFNRAPDTGTFATNIADWFTDNQPGNFHAYSTNFGLTQGSLANVMTNAGHTWTTGTNISFNLPTLLTYDGIFLGGNAVDNNVLIDYVNAGGNVYLMAGTGAGGPVGEANRWNTFLNAFGFEYATVYNGLGGNTPISSSHPIFSNVNAIYSSNGNSIIDLEPSNSANQVLVTSGGQGLIAVYDGNPITPVPTPAAVLPGLLGMGFSAIRKRNLAETEEA